jgi:hypothetical protein
VAEVVEQTLLLWVLRVLHAHLHSWPEGLLAAAASAHTVSCRRLVEDRRAGAELELAEVHSLPAAVRVPVVVSALSGPAGPRLVGRKLAGRGQEEKPTLRKAALVALLDPVVRCRPAFDMPEVLGQGGIQEPRVPRAAQHCIDTSTAGCRLDWLPDYCGRERMPFFSSLRQVQRQGHETRDW